MAGGYGKFVSVSTLSSKTRVSVRLDSIACCKASYCNVPPESDDPNPCPLPQAPTQTQGKGSKSTMQQSHTKTADADYLLLHAYPVAPQDKI